MKQIQIKNRFICFLVPDADLKFIDQILIPNGIRFYNLNEDLRKSLGPNFKSTLRRLKNGSEEEFDTYSAIIRLLKNTARLIAVDDPSLLVLCDVWIGHHQVLVAPESFSRYMSNLTRDFPGQSFKDSVAERIYNTMVKKTAETQSLRLVPDGSDFSWMLSSSSFRSLTPSDLDTQIEDAMRTHRFFASVDGEDAASTISSLEVLNTLTRARTQKGGVS